MKEIDLSKYITDPDLLAAAQKEYDDGVVGLKNKNTDLIESERLLKAANAELEMTAGTATERAQLAEAKASNDLAAYQEKEQALQAKEDALKLEHQSRIDAMTVDADTSKFLKGFMPDEAAQMFVGNEYKKGVEVIDGKVVPVDKALTLEQYKESITKGDRFLNHVIANVGSGAGAQGASNATTTGGGEQKKKLSNTTADYMATTLN